MSSTSSVSASVGDSAHFLSNKTKQLNPVSKKHINLNQNVTICNVKLYLFQQNTLVNDGNTCVIITQNERY
jgi:hypothetical protein